jgi:hypothetical protein
MGRCTKQNCKVEVREAVEAMEASTCTGQRFSPLGYIYPSFSFRNPVEHPHKATPYTSLFGWLVDVVIVNGKVKTLGTSAISSA